MNASAVPLELYGADADSVPGSGANPSHNTLQAHAPQPVLQLIQTGIARLPEFESSFLSAFASHHVDVSIRNHLKAVPLSRSQYR